MIRRGRAARRSNLRPGDLIVYSVVPGRPIDVRIYLGDSRVLYLNSRTEQLGLARLESGIRESFYSYLP